MPLGEPSEGLRYLENMLDEIEPFLLSKEIFWPLSGRLQNGRHYPNLSLGQLLLTLDELTAQAGAMELDQQRSFTDLEREFDELQQARPANLERKAMGELRQRLNLWRAYLTDVIGSNRSASSYEFEVRHRVLLSRLQVFTREGEDLEALRRKVKRQDSRLRPVFRQGGFLWDTSVEALYPRPEYWFLYGQLKNP